MSSYPARRRDVIDRSRLIAALRALDPSPSDKRRAQVLDLLRQALAAGRADVRGRFERDGNGVAAAQALSYLIDQLIRVLHDDTAAVAYPTPNPTLSERLTLVAVGGYGRGELAPFSDIDLLFLLPYKKTPRAEQVAEHMLYMLWDLGLKVGHATRSVDDCMRIAREDVSVRTALLEARWIWGEQELFNTLRRRFSLEVVDGTARDFVEAKLAERDARHVRMGDSRYVLEPNIKDGKGGLRDLHTLIWLAKYVYRVDSLDGILAAGVLTPEEAARFQKAHGFLWSLRFQLHYLAGRPEERLAFDVQAELARRMGYTDHAGSRGVERLMKHYFLVAKDVGDLTRIFCAALEAQQQRKPRLSISRIWAGWRRDPSGLTVDRGRLAVADEAAFLSDPVNLIRLFWIAHKHALDIHPAALRLISHQLKKVDAKLRADPEANRLFLELLTSATDPETPLRRMSEAGVFGRFVPDFGRVTAQMQYDMYHVYTVDEHTLFALGILSRIERGLLADELPLATSLMPKILSRRALFVALLLHDIAKGRGGDHSELGERIALKLGPRFGLTDEETETAAWLVRHHLLMSNTAFKRDLSDPRTIAKFVDQVQSPERLKLLLVLTVADIRAVGPKVWNNWKASLLRELYGAAEDLMTGPLNSDSPTARRRERIDRAVAALRTELSEWPQGDFDAHVARVTPAYWLAVDAGTAARHARVVRRAELEQAPLAVETRVEPGLGVTELTLYAGDHPGLFARIAGALAVSGANIVDAKIFTLSNGMALDTFWLQDAEGGPFDRPEKLARLAVLIEQALSGRLRSLAELRHRRTGPTRTRVFTVRPRVLIDNTASGTHTVIEVNGRDRPGLLYDLTSALNRLQLQIATAKVSTFGERVVDVFYVKDIFGLKVDRESKLAEIREGLLAALADPAAEPAPAPAKPAAGQAAE